MKSMKLAAAATSIFFSSVSFGQALPALPVALPGLGALPLPTALPALPSLPLALPSLASLPTLGGLGLPSLNALPLPALGALPGLGGGLSGSALPAVGGLGLPSLNALPLQGLGNLSGLVGGVTNLADVGGLLVIPGTIVSGLPVGVPSLPALSSLQSLSGLGGLTNGLVPNLGGLANAGNLLNLAPALSGSEALGALPVSIVPEITLTVDTGLTAGADLALQI